VVDTTRASKEIVMSEKDDSFDIFGIERVFPNADALFSFKIEPLESVREQCDIVLDTNVLLLPYATGPNSLKQIQTIYETLKRSGRLFVPSQVAREFARIRANKLSEILKTLGDKRSQIQKPSIGRYPLLERLSEYSEVVKVEKQLGEQVKAYQEALSRLLDAIRKWGWNDPVAELYREVFNLDTIRAPSQSKEEIETELKYRITNKIPPGYKDASKDDRGVGDLLIWMTILEIGAERQKPLLFVTGEEKADWQHRSENQGLLPRCELVDEFRRRSSGNPFYIASFSGLLELFDAPTEVVSEVREQEENFEAREGLKWLMKLAATDPRTAIKQSWLLLGKTILRAANVSGDNVEPNSQEISASLKRLESNVQFSDRLISSVRELQSTAMKVFYQSKWAYDPSSEQAEEFIAYGAAARSDLGEDLK